MSLLKVQRDAHSDPFFEAAEQGTLMIRQCSDCAFIFEPGARRCTTCQSDNVAWIPASGSGRLITWAVPHVRNAEKVMVPAYGVAVVELDEGPWIHAHVDADALSVLQPDACVRVRFAEVTDGERLPTIVPA
jgi:uncharacterized protein